MYLLSTTPVSLSDPRSGVETVCKMKQRWASSVLRFGAFIFIFLECTLLHRMEITAMEIISYNALMEIQQAFIYNFNYFLIQLTVTLIVIKMQ